MRRPDERDAKGQVPAAATAKVFERELKIRFAHCDPAGIVFFPQYFVMLNDLIEDWFERGLHIDYAQFVRERRLGTPTVHVACDFKAPSRMGDTVVQRLAVRRIGRSSLELGVDYVSGDELRLRLTQIVVCTSLDSHRALPWPDGVRAALEAAS